jgi:ectoine hydroxylase-related dioxygenase (phytanoyl-CoA dioxygenase family)
MYGSRDLISLWPEVCELPRQSQLRELLHLLLGADVGLVRALFFDKPPERSWSLPWHRDQTIAVIDNALPSSHFQRPTTKAGIPHVEAPQWLLERMLTLRIHLDPMTPANGPLSVIPGSHRLAEESQAAPVEIHCAAGDVLAMRPLISHSSSAPHADNALHRRIVHLEFAPLPALPDGYQWQWFLPVA